jgi:ribonuclease Z
VILPLPARERETQGDMRPIFTPELVNGAFGDPALLIDFKFVRRALLFDIGDVGRLPTRKLLRVSDIFISHAHMDHFAGFDRLLRVCLGRSKGVHLYGPPQFLDRVEHKLAAYTWNVVQNYATEFTVTAHELLPDWRMNSARFRSRCRFVREASSESSAPDGVLLAEPELRVRATLIDHETPCLAFTLEESTHINIWKSKLAELGLPTGPWLQELKAAVLAGVPDDTPIRAAWHDRHGSHERVVALGELKANVVRLVPGQKICYVTDAAYTEANMSRIVALAARSDLLFIEAAFLHEDLELARGRFHLTARQAGELAHAAGVSFAVPFHFSPRYMDRELELREQFAGAFRGDRACG